MIETTSGEQLRILLSLLELDRPLEAVLRDVAGLAWDSEQEVVRLRAQHVVAVLHRYRSGGLTAAEVEGWANAIECREDFGVDPEGGALLETAIFDLANPTLQGALTSEAAERWIERLSTARDR